MVWFPHSQRLVLPISKEMFLRVNWLKPSNLPPKKKKTTPPPFDHRFLIQLIYSWLLFSSFFASQCSKSYAVINESGAASLYFENSADFQLSLKFAL